MKSLKLAFAILTAMSLSSFTTAGTGDNPEPKPDGNESNVEFRIQLASYDDEVPAEELDQLTSIEGVSVMTSKGKTVVVTAPYLSEKEASYKLPEFRQMGFKKAMKVVVVEDYIIPAKTYHFFYDHRKCSAAEKDKLFTPEIRVID